MGNGTSIEWAEASINPIRARNRETGKIGWFCAGGGCYAEAMNHHLGTGIDYRAQDESKVEIFLDEKILAQPLHWRRPRRIFWGSMTDLFAPFVRDEWLDCIFAVCALTPQHRHLFLTKRAERMWEYLANALDGVERERWRLAGPLPALERTWPLPQVWAGVYANTRSRRNEQPLP